LSELATRFPRSAALQTTLAEAQYRNGDAVGAATTLRRALALDPARVEAQLLAAQLFLDADRPKEAAAAYRAVLQIKPESRAAELGLGRALVLGFPETEAEAFVAALVARYPNDPAPRVLRGVLYERRGDTSGALAAYGEALAIDPRDADAKRGAERISRRP
jgi:predicted Zn-dependent protease